MGCERNDFIRDIIDDDLRAGRHHARRDAVPARAERLPPHRPREVDLPELRHRARLPGHVQPPLRRHEPGRRKTSSTSSRSSATCAGSASTPTAVLFSADYFPKMYELAERLVREGKAYVVRSRPTSRSASTAARCRSRASRARSATARVDENLALLRAHEGRRAPRRRVHAAREDRHGVGEHEDARSAALPDPPRAPPPHRRRVVHLPDVRLGAPARGRDRGHHALDLHARVREQPRALRLGARPHRAVAAAPAPVRVRAARARLHGDEQAQAAARSCRASTSAAGTIRACRRSPACAGAATRPRRSARSAT